MSTDKKDIVERFQKFWAVKDFSLSEFALDDSPSPNRDGPSSMNQTDLICRDRAENRPCRELPGDTKPHPGSFRSEPTDDPFQPLKETANDNSDRDEELILASLPHHVGNFQLIEFTGEDSATAFYDARQLKLDRKVNVRELRASDEFAIKKAKLIAVLEHPNLENIIDFIEVDARHYLVSQYEFGSTLADILESSPDLITPLRSIRWTRNLVEALMESHRFDVAHLAISPRNILIRESGEAVLLSPSLDSQLEQKIANREFGELGDGLSMPFPYRSITHHGPGDLNLWLGDAISLGLIFFQMLTKLTLENFYNDAPLPQEAMRLKKLIVDQLDYARAIDPELKAACRRSTVDAMTEMRTWGLSDFHAELLILESSYGEESSYS